VIISVRMTRTVLEHTDDDNSMQSPATSSAAADLVNAFVPPTTLFTIDPDDYDFAMEHCHAARVRAGPAEGDKSSGAGSSAVPLLPVEDDKPSPSIPAPAENEERLVQVCETSGGRRSQRIARQQEKRLTEAV